jgi:23S rRNA (guanosine2251-2'-O)-methyltransferase
MSPAGGRRGGGKGGARGSGRQSWGRPGRGPDRGGKSGGSKGGGGGGSRGGGSRGGGPGGGGSRSGGAPGSGARGGGAPGAGSRGGGGVGSGRAARGGGPAFAEPRGGGPTPDAAPPVPEGAVTSRRMVIYGRNPVREALRGKRKVHRVWATEAAAAEGWGPAKVTIASTDEIEERAESDAHQGLCALVDPYPYADAAQLLRQRDPLLVALDEITDPQNLGAVCRTAEAAGATAVVIPERRSAEVTPAVCKASAGAVEHLPIARVRNLADFLAGAKEAGCWVYGAAAGATTAYDQPDYKGGVVAVLGAEGKGLRPRVASMCDDLVALPLRGRIESLNVSATAAVLLYEMLQQRLDTST